MSAPPGHADALEFPHPDADFRDAAVVPELRMAAVGHRLSPLRLARGLDSLPPQRGVGLISANMMSSFLAVARIAPASEDGVQLGGVKRPCVLTVRIACEPAETSGAVEEPGRR